MNTYLTFENKRLCPISAAKINLSTQTHFRTIQRGQVFHALSLGLVGLRSRDSRRELNSQPAYSQTMLIVFRAYCSHMLGKESVKCFLILV